MQYRSLGKTGIEVSVITLGCWALIEDANWGKQSRADSEAAIDAALETGINFLDTAPLYGDGASEVLLGEVLKGRRDQVVIADKIFGSLTRERVFSECEQSLQRLQTDYIDLYQLHWPDRETPFEETFAALESLVEQGKIRAFGVSNFGSLDLEEALVREVKPVINQMPYSLIWRGVEFEVLPKCHENGIGILSYSSLMQGLLTGKFANADAVPEGRARTRHFSPKRPQIRHQEPGAEEETFAAIDRIRAICAEQHLPMAQIALAWGIAQEGVTSVIAGARNAEQVRANVSACEINMDLELQQALNDATESLKTIFGTNMDPWQSESRMR